MYYKVNIICLSYLLSKCNHNSRAMKYMDFIAVFLTQFKCYNSVISSMCKCI